MTLDLDIRHRAGAFALEARLRLAGPATALCGPSGAGKTTLLNIVAGLIRPDEGRIVFDDVVWFDSAQAVFVAPHRRRIGYVFQESRLFPHLNVRRNLLYGRWLRRARDEAIRFDDVVELLGIAHLLDRAPATLSGGEAQRVAIGRALLAGPRLLLMDEPLASLDAARRAEVLPYLERLRDRFGLPTIYVSHALDEVQRIANEIVTLENGAVTSCVRQALTRAR